MVRVAFFAACAKGVVVTTMMSMLSRTAFGGECGQALGLATRREVVDAERLPVHVAQVAQPLKERTPSCRPERPWIERQQAARVY
jgi:hypothetical protein